ncbi:VOC family protein [Dyadobacter sandarakinus]|uniref:VOC family protein n=1 Tax=Dyadobacter sandarakinus TaxID=2747268 RepID=A0ABX7I2U9_9BACT|nr:VOC family protein [Dyadobacter sandarakinus]QRQ99846.1 VOC family protein [Dyadobacter sandarakinus]
MPKINTYLNFDGQAEEAFNFYKSVFGGEFMMVQRMSDMPGAERLPESERNRVMHISLPFGTNDVLMASDILPSAGHKLTVGNFSYISVFADSREQADAFFNGLSQGGNIEMPMEDAFWGDYFGSFQDKYGVGWMINFPAQHQG